MRIYFYTTACFLLLSACAIIHKNNRAPESVADLQGGDSPSVTMLADIRPKGPIPEWGPTIRPQMQAVIEKLSSYGDLSPLKLTPTQARKNHTMKDAVRDLLEENHIPQPVFLVDTAGFDMPVHQGTIHLSVYTPKKRTGRLPVILYYHAGGFVLANIEVYSASAKILAEKTGAIVVSVGYRLAPEHKFPTAHNDAYSAYIWVINNAPLISGDPAKIALVGESAGGNLAIATAIKLRDASVPVPKAIISVYPIASADNNSASYLENAGAKPLSRPLMIWFMKHYLNNDRELNDPRINLVAADLRGLPPTTVITDEIDPLLSEDLLLVERLKAAGVETDSRVYKGVTHQFFGFGAAIPEAGDAEAFVAAKLRSAFRLP